MGDVEETRLHRLFERAKRWFEEGRAALKQIPCRQGCSHCCHGIFPITILDQSYIQQGLMRLPSATRSAMTARARVYATSIETRFPRLTQSTYIDRWTDDEIDAVVTAFDQVPCPALDDRGSCLIYGHRPITCRMMGLPVQRDGLLEGACDVQTSVPLIRLSDVASRKENEVVEEEANLIAEWRTATRPEGEELLLPYAFLSASLTEPIA